MKKPFLLLADDDEDDRFFFQQALASLDTGAECLTVRDGTELLTILNNDYFSLPDYIFLDLNMPVMDGLQCLRLIKKDPKLKKCKVVLYSTAIDKKTEESLLNAGAFAYFIKPTGSASLAQALREICSL